MQLATNKGGRAFESFPARLDGRKRLNPASCGEICAVDIAAVAIEDIEAEITGTSKSALKLSMVENHGIRELMRLRNASISSTGRASRRPARCGMREMRPMQSCQGHSPVN
jgi:hypothetical protein